MNVHYVCKGDCKGVSEVPKVCDTEGCSHKGQPLEACSCADGAHGEAPTSVN
ncbi:MAG: hypothetical protein AAB455_01450 [Patescibacteria group bacterium]